MTSETQAPQETLTIKRANFADLRIALKKGWADFRAAPKFGLFFGGIYMLGGLLLFALTFHFDISWAVYPLVIGFALIGPFTATGLYEVSRRLQADQPLTWQSVLLVIWTQHRRELGWMAFVMLFVFWIWMYQARTLFVVFFGSDGFATLGGFVDALFTTQAGFIFLLAGHAVGAVISLVLYALTVVSCPLLLDKDVDFVTAMLTSIRTVIASPVVMLCWGIFVVLCVLIAALPAFAGLPLILPILGHATWHLYKSLLVPAG